MLHAVLLMNTFNNTFFGLKISGTISFFTLFLNSLCVVLLIMKYIKWFNPLDRDQKQSKVITNKICNYITYTWWKVVLNSMLLEITACLWTSSFDLFIIVINTKIRRNYYIRNFVSNSQLLCCASFEIKIKCRYFNEKCCTF